jgi:hypothetical protein
MPLHYLPLFLVLPGIHRIAALCVISVLMRKRQMMAADPHKLHSSSTE